MSIEPTVLMPDNAVAIIGGGPAGLVAARWLSAHGLKPVIFEAAARLGGQWNSASAASATWPGMRTNTSRVMTAFSDLDHKDGASTFVTQGEILDYLERYAITFGLLPMLRLSTRVEKLERGPGGAWLVHSISGDARKKEVFARAVVATGRHGVANVPAVPGLDGFSGALGVLHTAQYNGAQQYRGRKVVVAGCSISALEIASDLAYGGAAEVVSTNRRQRYVLPKIIAGVPTDHLMFTRAAALLGEALDPQQMSVAMKAKVVSVAGNPKQFGALEPADNIFEAGISQAQNFLPAVAEGRIGVRPWIDRIDGPTVHFTDGSACDADALVFGTGYRLSMPWLDSGIAATITLEEDGVRLYEETFHPDLPGLAFLGIYDLIGPYLPVLELQARWIAYSFAGLVAAPSKADMRSSVDKAAAGGQPKSFPTHVMALKFARNAGVEPDLAALPALERALLFGPLSPASFRITGPDALPDARVRARDAAAAFGAIVADQLTAEEQAQRQLIYRRDASTAA